MPSEERADPSTVFDAKAGVYERFGNGAVERLAREGLPHGGRVLDIGCASGGLLALLTQAGFRAGIEPAHDAAERARSVADEVHRGGVGDDLPWPPASFDVVVLADVIEHLVDPQAALERGVAMTAPGGLVVVSVPNIAHWRARCTVASGSFPREDSGTFDATHLQWFTAQRLTRALVDAGLVSVDLVPVVPALRNHVPMLRAGTGRVERAWQALGRRRPNLFGYQLVASGRRPRH